MPLGDGRSSPQLFALPLPRQFTLFGLTLCRFDLVRGVYAFRGSLNFGNGNKAKAEYPGSVTVAIAIANAFNSLYIFSRQTGIAILISILILFLVVYVCAGGFAFTFRL